MHMLGRQMVEVPHSFTLPMSGTLTTFIELTNVLFRTDCNQWISWQIRIIVYIANPLYQVVLIYVSQTAVSTVLVDFILLSIYIMHKKAVLFFSLSVGIEPDLNASCF